MIDSKTRIMKLIANSSQMLKEIRTLEASETKANLQEAMQGFEHTKASITHKRKVKKKNKH